MSGPWRVVVSVVGFVDDLLIVIDGGDLAVVPYYAKVAACDGGGAGGDVVLAAEGGVYGFKWDNFINGSKTLRMKGNHIIYRSRSIKLQFNRS